MRSVLVIETTSARKILKSPLQRSLTVAPVAALGVGESLDVREYLRLPKNRQVDAIFSLSRSTWNSLILPCRANNFRPPIKSISLRRPGTIRGCRLIVVASARSYFESLLAQGETEKDSAK